MRISGADIRPRGPAPALGGDTDAVLAELGYSPDESAALAESGIVGR
jgi:crotonobetainyl-CoA:carnitine CoA-transferase CaiB-like acyl-CoA transferase